MGKLIPTVAGVPLDRYRPIGGPIAPDRGRGAYRVKGGGPPFIFVSQGQTTHVCAATPSVTVLTTHQTATDLRPHAQEASH